MLNKLRQLAQQWLDKRDDLDYFREHPLAATVRAGVKYSQALAAVQASHSTYTSLERRLHELDARHGYQLLRTAVAADPDYIRFAWDQEAIPTDILVKALERFEIWELIINHNWVAYDNAKFKLECPDVADLLSFYRSLNLSAHDAYTQFQAHLGKSDYIRSPSSITLPLFD